MSEESEAINNLNRNLSEINGNLAAIHGALVGLQKCVVAASLEGKSFDNIYDKAYTINEVHQKLTQEEF